MRILWAASLLTFAGCYADAQVRGPSVGIVAPAPSVYVEPAPAPEPVYVAPAMVEVEPGVQVIEDYDQPVFYSDSLYWRYDGGVWYSSRYHDRGWYRNDRVPERVHHIDRPETYRHYRAGGGVRVEGRHEEHGAVHVEGRREEHPQPVHVEGRHEEPRREEHPVKHEERHDERKHDDKKHH